MKNLAIFPYKMGSQSAKDLAKGLEIFRLKEKGGKYRGNAKKTIINWGRGSAFPANMAGSVILNEPLAVSKASNKLTTMRELQKAGVALPEWTDKRQDALAWLNDGAQAFCRTKLQGHSGEGIVIAEGPKELVDAPLYTKWNRIGKEFRVHVANGKVIDIQRKARKREVEDDDVNWKVRNLAGGFIFARGDAGEIKADTIKECENAIIALGLDFGAVDVIETKADGKPMVLEVNTACGLMGTTLDKYVEAFETWE